MSAPGVFARLASSPADRRQRVRTPAFGDGGPRLPVEAYGAPAYAGMFGPTAGLRAAGHGRN